MICRPACRTGVSASPCLEADGSIAGKSTGPKRPIVPERVRLFQNVSEPSDAAASGSSQRPRGSAHRGQVSGDGIACRSLRARLGDTRFEGCPSDGRIASDAANAPREGFLPRLHFKGKVFVENHHLAVPFHELLPVREKGVSERASLRDMSIRIHMSL